MFPGYLFVRLDEEDKLWSSMRSTRGVRDFVRFAKTPATIPDNIISGLQSAGAGELLTISKVPKKGSLLMIEDGPFKGLEAIFQIMDGTERAIVLLNVLGKEQKLSIDINHLPKF
jgi:transcriptional antiterminator RfaH